MVLLGGREPCPMQGIELVLLVALPLGLVVTGFFRRGEWRALRSLLPSVSRA